MVQKQLPEEFKEFLHLLNIRKVKYLLLGGWAVGMYSTPRFTADMDILIGTDDKNIESIVNALSDFGIKNVPSAFFHIDDNTFRIGRSPIKIEILNRAKGIDFIECYKRKKNILVGGVRVKVISRADLITNKKAVGRAKDIADVEELEK